MLDWIVVGGGVHGVTCASFLREGGVSAGKLAILDPLPNLLSAWKNSTEAVGVKQLRSTHVHHLARDPYSLIRFAGTATGRRFGRLRGKYGHPDLELFNAHSDRVIQTLLLEESHLQEKVVDLVHEEESWRVECGSGRSFYGKNVVLAIGCDRSLPEWLAGDLLQDPRIQVGFEAESVSLGADESLLVVGAGMSGVQLALGYAESYPGQVTLLSRRAPVKSVFDSDPGWNGPKLQDGFRAIDCFEARRERIRGARFPGSVPPRLLSGFRRAVEAGSLSFLQGSLEGINAEPNVLSASVRSADSNDLLELQFSNVVLGTGFSSRCPQECLIKKIAERETLALAPCGFPAVRSLSHWGKDLHLSGALAELQVGPVARNIVGARIAAAELRRFR